MMGPLSDKIHKNTRAIYSEAEERASYERHYHYFAYGWGTGGSAA
jgi:hypothetical protein